MAKSNHVRVHIDQKPYESPNPTTGNALYLLGGVEESEVLFREVDGNREDQPVPRDDAPVHLDQDAHFHSQMVHGKKFNIIVNGEQKEVEKKKLTFSEVVALAYPNPATGGNIIYTVTYKKAKSPHQGTMTPGSSVIIKNGTIFNVTKTDKS